MEFIQIMSTATILVISALLLTVNIAYIMYLNRDRKRWKRTANRYYRVLNESYRKNNEENLINENLKNSRRYKVIT